MKQIIFAVLLLAMATFTGCLNENDKSIDENTYTTDDSISDTTDEPKNNELIVPVGEVGGHMSPKTSTIKVDYGIQGHWNCEDGEYVEDSDGNQTWIQGNCEYTPCLTEGWQEFVSGNGHEYTDYCDLDGHRNQATQVIITKNSNEVTIECIKDWNQEECKYYEDSVYVIFTSIEGLKEMIYCDTFRYQGGSNIFNTCKASLGFEPVGFEVTHNLENFDRSGWDYYNYVTFRVF